MDLLLCIVEANAAAKALANVAAQSLHAVDDCSCIVEWCNKVLPAALSALESAASTSEGALAQAVECTQGCNAAMVQLQMALERLTGHDNEGVLGILLKHPAAWLDTYRAFRGFTAQVIGINCLVRAPAQRGRSDDSDEALQTSIKSLMGICSRAREAAHLLGSDLPEFARAAAAAGWSQGRVSFALTKSSSSSPSQGCGGCRQADCRWSGIGSAATTASAVTVPGSASAVRKKEQHQPQPTSCCQHHLHQQRMSLLRRISKAAACSSPAIRRVCNSMPALPCTLGAGVARGAALENAAYALVSRIQDTILFDSEVDQLEQDQAYLRQRVALLSEFCGCYTAEDMTVSTASANMPVTAKPGQLTAASSAAAMASLVQSEMLLAAVDLRLGALRETSDSLAGGVYRQPFPTGQAAAAALCAGGGGAVVRSHIQTTSGQLLGTDDMFDDERKRRPGLCWLPVCFVGA
ncbi:hypothetical protein VaNZ11_013881 [Volvox africanus]|uniref:Uncharacterized protein n=1 Tax=Volvox africanus TaxID=51714 RepID=A0ABQ5SH91_9CHLO|nr:hypothetical protein VaNZ11_013881 [Volvox africanus]